MFVKSHIANCYNNVFTAIVVFIGNERSHVYLWMMSFNAGDLPCLSVGHSPSVCTSQNIIVQYKLSLGPFHRVMTMIVTDVTVAARQTLSLWSDIKPNT